MPEALIRRLRQRAEHKDFQIRHKVGRLSPHRVSEIISEIGEQTGVIVKSPRDEGGRTKYASAHDLRRGGAERLINAGVSAETLQVVMRHRSFSTTERFYGAKKKAQFAARELHEKFASGACSDALLKAARQLTSTEGCQLSAISYQPEFVGAIRCAGFNSGSISGSIGRYTSIEPRRAKKAKGFAQ